VNSAIEVRGLGKSFRGRRACWDISFEVGQGEVFGLPTATVNREEGPAYGAALLAAVGAGAFPDLQSAARATLSRGALEHPDGAAHAAYAEPYARFNEAYRPSRQGSQP